jgi:Domain of unknown function (DUF1707)
MSLRPDDNSHWARQTPMAHHKGVSTPSDPRQPLRIGHEERNAAIRALDEHLSAGRLDPDEYADRMAAASMARTRDDIDPLFVDLPAPHPFPPAYSWGPPVTSYPAPGWSVPPRTPAPRPMLIQVLATMIAVGLAVLAFAFTLGGWVVFLIIPLASSLFGGRRRYRRPGPFGWGPHSWRL